jgi:hypothetical protein
VYSGFFAMEIDMNKYVINIGDDSYKSKAGGGWLTNDIERARTYKTKANANIGLANLRRNFKLYPNAFIEELKGGSE